MHPVLFTIGPVTLYTYGAMLVVALLVCVWQATRAARHLPGAFVAVTGERLVDLICLSVLGGIIGGRLVYVLLHGESFTRSPLDALAIWQGGLVWYGGLLGGLLTAWWYVRAKRLVWWRVADQVAPFLALGHAVGRIGCFLNGCCYGKPTDAWCGVVFPGDPHAVIPTQLFEALGLWALYLVLRRLQRPEVLRRPGRLSGVYCIGYAVLRFLIEYVRGDQTIAWAGLTLQQLISLGVLFVGVILFTRREGKRQNEKGKTTSQKVKF